MANQLQIKRGVKASLPTLAAGELAFCTDTYEVFVGTGAANKLVGGPSPAFDSLSAGGAEKLKIWTYTHTVTSGEVSAHYFTHTTTSVTRTKVRSLTVVVYHASAGNVVGYYDSFYATGWWLVDATTVRVNLGSSVAVDDVVSITIIEAQ